MNLNGRASLDPRWTTHHVGAVEGFMLATIKVTRKLPSTAGATPVYNQATKTWSGGTFTTVLDNTPARIQFYGLGGDNVVGQDTTSRRLMRVQITDKTSDVNVDDIVTILTCPDDPMLTKYQLEVRGAIGSSNSWIRELTCEADLKHG
jgi:hypothetical protein